MSHCQSTRNPEEKEFSKLEKKVLKPGLDDFLSLTRQIESFHLIAGDSDLIINKYYEETNKELSFPFESSCDRSW